MPYADQMRALITPAGWPADRAKMRRGDSHVVIMMVMDIVMVMGVMIMPCPVCCRQAGCRNRAQHHHRHGAAQLA